MTTTPVLLCCYLLTGISVAIGCDLIFIKGGFNKLCFSLKETALLAVAWPYYLFTAFTERD